MAGPVGTATFTASYTIVGIGAFLLPFALIAVGLYAGFGRPILAPLTASGLLLTLASILAFAGLFPGTQFGGKTGTWLKGVLSGFFGFWGALVLLVAIIAIGIAIVSDLEMLGAFLDRLAHALWERVRRQKEDGEEFSDESGVVGVPESEEENEVKNMPDGASMPEHQPVVTVFNRASDDSFAKPAIVNFDAEYDPPPLSILGADRGKPGVGDIKANANIIKRTFQNFGIHLEMDEVSVGPTVTRYAVKPAEGVRLSKIVSLANNLELALAAHPVRIGGADSGEIIGSALKCRIRWRRWSVSADFSPHPNGPRARSP